MKLWCNFMFWWVTIHYKIYSNLHVWDSSFKNIIAYRLNKCTRGVQLIMKHYQNTNIAFSRSKPLIMYNHV